jgi:hypothetical protein
MADITPDPIMRVALGFMAAKHLFAASAIGLFEGLTDGPATLDDLTQNAGCRAGPWESARTRW